MEAMRLVVALLILAGCARDAKPAGRAPAPVAAVELHASCAPAVRAEINQAVTLLHHMTYTQARAAFRDVARRDPRCAMAYWGIAMTRFTPLWPTRPSAADLQAGWEAAQRARELAPATARERAFVEAVVAFFEQPESSDYWARVARWEAAMKRVYDGSPDDVEAATFYALALLATARPGPSLQEHSARAIALLRPMQRAHPDHPGAMHYIIHADDIPGRERADLEVVRRYEQIAPDNPHALHMPTHIYTRLGDWDGVIRGNLRAAEAALRYPTGEHGELVWDEFPHAIEYLVYAYLQQGSDSQAGVQIERLLATPNLEPSAKTVFHLASTRARYALERHAWVEAAALVPGEPALVDWRQFPWPEAVLWFARGYGARHNGDSAEPARALAQLQELEQRAAAAGEVVFARQIQILRLMLEGFCAHTARDDSKALALLQQAVELEGATPKPPVTPASTLPAPEVLGDLLLELGRADEALAAYRLALQRFPRRFNSTLGVARALDAKHDAAAAAQAYCELLAIAPASERALDEARLRCQH
jgi:tetratricopeptide (TPR) repeat protein